MGRRQDIRDEIGAIRGSYSSGCIICKGVVNDENQIDIYEIHFNCYTLIKLILDLEQVR